MEFEDIDLSRKPSNRAQPGRYGHKTNKTIKYNRGEVSHHRDAPETIVVINTENQESGLFNGTERQQPGISLNARKNWEIVEKMAEINGRDNLKRSQDDFDVDYSNTRVAVLENSNYISKGNRQKDYYALYQTDRKKDGSGEQKIERVAGENRKGFFVKEKRKKGKKGVKRPESSNSNNNEARSRNSDSSSDENDSQEENELAQKVDRIIIVEKKPRKVDFTTNHYHGCSCPTCRGWEKNVESKKRNEVKKSALDAL